MASAPLMLMTLLAAVVLLANYADGATKPSPVAPEPTVAPGPIPAVLNLTEILVKGSQFTTLIHLLKETQIEIQFDSQLESSSNGLTLFAPTDNAFGSLKPGTLNSLTPQQQVQLILYHVLPRFYSTSMFQTSSNPVNTQATGSDGVYSLNITTSTSQINISTGVNETPLRQALYTTYPLAVYEIDAVLLPYDLFGPKKKHHVAASPPKSTATPSGDTPTAPSTPAASETSTTSGAGTRIAGWLSSLLGAGIGFGMIGVL